MSAITHGTFKEKIYVVYGGLDIGQFVVTKNKAITVEEFRILSVGRITEKKGFYVLVKALKILDENGIKFKCEIVGSGTRDRYNRKLRKLIGKLGLGQKLFLSGTRPFEYVLEKYKEADMFVLPCLIAQNGDRDVIPNVLKEAMAMKLPVISTQLPAMPELIDSGEDGILVPENDEKSLAAAMEELIKDKEKARMLGENARRKIEERFDVSKNTEMLYRLLSETCASYKT